MSETEYRIVKVTNGLSESWFEVEANYSGVWRQVFEYTRASDHRYSFLFSARRRIQALKKRALIRKLRNQTSRTVVE